MLTHQLREALSSDPPASHTYLPIKTMTLDPEHKCCTSMCVETVCLSFGYTLQAAKTRPTWTGQQLLRLCQEQNSAAKT